MAPFLGVQSFLDDDDDNASEAAGYPEWVYAAAKRMNISPAEAYSRMNPRVHFLGPSNIVTPAEQAENFFRGGDPDE